MKLSIENIHAIVAFHCSRLGDVQYPCQLEIQELFQQRDKWDCVQSHKADRLFFLHDKTLPNSDLQFPLLRYLTFLENEGEDQPQNIEEKLRSLGGKIIFLIESYNDSAFQLIKSLNGIKTSFCQKKMLCPIEKISSHHKERCENIKIRNYVAGSDEDRYIAFYNKALGYLTGSDVNRSFIEQIVRRPSFDPDGYFLAESDGRTVGFLNIEVEPWGPRRSGFAYIYQIGVDEAWQGAGLASALLTRALNFALNKGCNRIGVGVRESNLRAVNFFLSKGFYEAYRVTGYLVKND